MYIANGLLDPESYIRDLKIEDVLQAIDSLVVRSIFQLWIHRPSLKYQMFLLNESY